MGHCGQLLTLLLSTWHQSIGGRETLHPVHIRAMLSADPREVNSGRMELSTAIVAILDDVRTELNALGTTLPDSEDLVNLYAAQTQFGLVEATSATTSRIDPGAAILTLVATCLDSVVREDNSLLSSFAQMLADLASSPQSRSPRAAVPHEQRSFTVDLVLSGAHSEAEELSGEGPSGARSC